MTKKRFNKTNERISGLLEQGINPFIYYLNCKKKHNIKWYFEYRDFVKYLSKISPSFKMLWCISDFIQHIEFLYMYHNTDSSEVHNVKTTKHGIKSFRINNSNDFYIEYTLYESDHRISLKVKRLWGDIAPISEMTFIDGCAKLETRTDEILMYNIINWTMSPIQELFKQYYKIAEEV